MQYPVFIQNGLHSGYGVVVPDLPGCYSAGKTIEEAVKNVYEAIECHLEGLLLDNDPVPLKQSIEHHLDNPELKDDILALGEIPVFEYSIKNIKSA